MEGLLASTMLSVLLSLLLCCAVTESTHSSVSASYYDITLLKDQLVNTSFYDTTTRPLVNQSEPIQLRVILNLIAIHGLDEKAESFKTTAYLEVEWVDDFLNWDPELIGGLREIELPMDKIWTPDLTLKNSLQNDRQIGDNSLLLWIFSDGTVTWRPLEVFLSTCSMDITKFPRDVHTCSLTFVAWSYQTAGVSFLAKNEVDIDNLESNHAWEVIQTRMSFGGTGEAEISFHITLRRKQTYSMLTLVLPVLILYILNLFVFLLPSDGGEKSGYAVTVFLSFTVFLTIIDSSFPQNSDTVSYFAIFVIGGTVQSTVITVVVLAMVRCASLDDTTSVPGWLVAFARFRKTRSCRSSKNKKSSKIANSDAESTEVRKTDKDGNISNEEQNEEDKNCWKTCIDSLDLVFVCVFTSSFMIFTIIFFVNIYD